jgi:hypothetical protein
MQLHLIPFVYLVRKEHVKLNQTMGEAYEQSRKTDYQGRIDDPIFCNGPCRTNHLRREIYDSVPFYVGNIQMPSGSYLLTQPDDFNKSIAVVRSADGLHSTFIGVTPTQSLNPPRQSKIVFEKYGNTLYFNRVLLQGDTYGIVADSTKGEKKAEETASVVEERSIAASGQ